MAVQHDTADKPEDTQWEAQTVSRAVLQLSQLRCLLVSNETNFVLPRILLCCAYWSNLTVLHIVAGQDNVPLESQLIMLQLEILIKLHNVGCEVEFD